MGLGIQLGKILNKGESHQDCDEEFEIEEEDVVIDASAYPDIVSSIIGLEKEGKVVRWFKDFNDKITNIHLCYSSYNDVRDKLIPPIDKELNFILVEKCNADNYINYFKEYIKLGISFNIPENVILGYILFKFSSDCQGYITCQSGKYILEYLLFVKPIIKRSYPFIELYQELIKDPRNIIILC